MFYEKVLRELNRSRVRYIVVGGIAVNLHGVPRATADLDLLLRMESSNIHKLVQVMRKLGYKPRAPVKLDEIDVEKLEKWRKEKGLRVFTFRNPKVPYEEVDIVLEHSLDFDDAYGRVESIKARDLSIPLISIDDLMKLKQSSDRLQDISDVQALKKVKMRRQRHG